LSVKANQAEEIGLYKELAGRMDVRAIVAAGAFNVLLTGVAQAATPPPMSCPNAARYTEAGTQCTQASQANDVDSAVRFCQAAALEAGECAQAEAGLARIDEIGNEASFARMAGVAIFTQSHGQNLDVATGWLRVAMALYRKLYFDPAAPADVRADAQRDMGLISQMSWYVDGPPPQSPPGAGAPPPLRPR
jgi:hypothetical protein